MSDWKEIDSKLKAIEYINSIEPEHSRTSCDEGESNNAAGTVLGVTYNWCNRCTLFKIMELAQQ